MYYIDGDSPPYCVHSWVALVEKNPVKVSADKVRLIEKTWCSDICPQCRRDGRL